MTGGVGGAELCGRCVPPRPRRPRGDHRPLLHQRHRRPGSAPVSATRWPPLLLVRVRARRRSRRSRSLTRAAVVQLNKASVDLNEAIYRYQIETMHFLPPDNSRCARPPRSARTCV